MGAGTLLRGEPSRLQAKRCGCPEREVGQVGTEVGPGKFGRIGAGSLNNLLLRF